MADTNNETSPAPAALVVKGIPVGVPVPVDAELDTDSDNPISNKAVSEKFNEINTQLSQNITISIVTGYKDAVNRSKRVGGSRLINYKVTSDVNLSNGDYQVGTIATAHRPTALSYGMFETLSGVHGMAWVNTNGIINYHLTGSIAVGEELVFYLIY